MSPPSPAGRGSVGPAGMGACSRRCSPPPKMPLHLPGPPQTKLQDFARHPRLSPAVPWVLFPPVPVRCRPLPPYGHAGFRPWAPPHALLSAGGGGGGGGHRGPPFPSGDCVSGFKPRCRILLRGLPTGNFLGGAKKRNGVAKPPRHATFSHLAGHCPTLLGALGGSGQTASLPDLARMFCRQRQTTERPYNLLGGSIRPTSTEFRAEPRFPGGRKASQ